MDGGTLLSFRAIKIFIKYRVIHSLVETYIYLYT